LTYEWRSLEELIAAELIHCIRGGGGLRVVVVAAMVLLMMVVVAVSVLVAAHVAVEAD
jgi:hypothetical protein